MEFVLSLNLSTFNSHETKSKFVVQMKKCSSNKYSWWVSSPSSKMKSALTLMSVVLTFILSKTSKGSKLTARLRKTKRSKARKAPQPFLSKILFSCATKYHLSESNARETLTSFRLLTGVLYFEFPSPRRGFCGYQWPAVFNSPENLSNQGSKSRKK